MKYLKKITRVASVVWIALLFMSLTASAHAGSNNNGKADRIVGLWDVQVNVASCAGGSTLASFPAIHKYELGGTGQVTPGTNPAGLSAHMMSWTHLGGNDYLARFKAYRFDGAGNRIGWIVATNEVSINKSATAYTGSGIVEMFNNNGELQGASCPSFTGTRFSAEP
jgi:hypothetical protein